jgi:hypothetical protein
MPPRTSAIVAFAAVGAILLASPAVRAGDYPYFERHGWGVGTMDGRLLFYVGGNRSLWTPIPSPPEGPRWDFAYDALSRSILPVGVAGGTLLWLHRRRRARGSSPKAVGNGPAA